MALKKLASKHITYYYDSHEDLNLILLCEKGNLYNTPIKIIIKLKQNLCEKENQQQSNTRHTYEEQKKNSFSLFEFPSLYFLHIHYTITNCYNNRTHSAYRENNKYVSDSYNFLSYSCSNQKYCMQRKLLYIYYIETAKQHKRII